MGTMVAAIRRRRPVDTAQEPVREMPRAQARVPRDPVGLAAALDLKRPGVTRALQFAALLACGFRCKEAGASDLVAGEESWLPVGENSFCGHRHIAPHQRALPNDGQASLWSELHEFGDPVDGVVK